MCDRVHLHAALATFITVLAVFAAMPAFGRARSGHVRSDHRASPTAVSYHRRAARLTLTDWQTVKTAVRLRRMALARGRSAYYRHFAASLALSGLTQLHPIRPGRCAVAISYLYDNLLDLADAYPGEDWRPLRRLVRKQPSLGVCAPKPVKRVT